GRPAGVVPLVDRVGVAAGRDLDVLVAEQELADGGIEGEPVDSVAGRVDQHVGGAVDHVAGGDDVAPGLEAVLELAGTVARALPAVDREDRADGGVDVDVAGAVERIELQDVFALRVLRRDGDGLLDLLAPHDADVAARLDAVDEGAVGEVVELLDRLALHVDLAGEAEDVREPRLAHPARDDLGGQGDLLKEPGEITRRAGRAAEPIEDVSLEGGTGEGGGARPDGDVLFHGTGDNKGHRRVPWEYAGGLRELSSAGSRRPRSRPGRRRPARRTRAPRRGGARPRARGARGGG